ncbi:MAG: translation initiation factor IF-3 [Planctomycetaceae bacterium]|jgi:translation initiation factor IF-3|nr:translation initiation factor IF-3 [Planctomycetaceae bacterium]
MALMRQDPRRDQQNRSNDKSKQRINEAIRVPQVRVVSDAGEQLGIMDTRDALNRARDLNLDLVEVASDSKPPVCRIMDYGKFRYEMKKKQNKQSGHQTKLKEVRVRPKTGDHDIQVKVNSIKKFLAEKDKVQISVAFKGRELAHIDEGEKVLQGILVQLEEFGKLESPPKRADKRINCTVVPK